MVDSIHHGDLTQIKGIHASQARDIDPKLMRIGATLMMRVDATH
jgi:hypothetical protein